jgi:pilus assembly protein CpaB
MKPKSFILLGVSGLFGLVAAALFTSALGQPGAGVPMQSVLIATEDIEIGSLLTEQNCKIEQWPRNIVPEGIVVSAEETKEKRINIRLTKGAPIFRRDLADRFGSTMVPIPKNKKVVGLKVPAEDHIAGLLQPGHTVDVIGVFPHENRSYSNTFLRGIRVFAVGNRTSLETEAATKSNESDITVGLIVSERQSEMLTLVKRVASVRLAIRGVDDVEAESTAAEEQEGILSLEDLMGFTAKAAPLEPTAPANPVHYAPATGRQTAGDGGAFKMQVYRGDFRSEYVVEEGKLPVLVTPATTEGGAKPESATAESTAATNTDADASAAADAAADNVPTDY